MALRRGLPIALALVAIALGAPARGQDHDHEHDAYGHHHSHGAAAPAAASIPRGDGLPLVRKAGEYDIEPLRRLTVQDGGRRKPLDTFAREKIQLILGEPRFEREDPLYTLFSMLVEPDRFAAEEVLKIRNLQLVKLFGKAEKRATISIREIGSHEGYLKALREVMELGQGVALGPNQSAVLELRHREVYFHQLVDRMRLLPVPGKLVTEPWATLADPEGRSPESVRELNQLSGALAVAWRSGDPAAANAAIQNLANKVTEVQRVGSIEPWQTSIEIALNRSQPFHWSWIVLLCATALLGAATVRKSPWVYRPGMALLLVGLGLATFGLTARTLIVMRAPVSNLYEATIFATFTAVLVGFLFELAYRRAYFGLAAAVFGTLAFLLADLSPNMDRSISPLVPVLRSYWLNIHVTCMLLSYGTFAVAFVLGVLYYAWWFPAKGYPKWSIVVPAAICLGGVALLLVTSLGGDRLELWHYIVAMLVAPTAAVLTSYAWVSFTGGGAKMVAEDAKSLHEIERYMYRAIQVGFLILVTGVLLGAVWANESWGRYWGWDPKETWAFITILVYGVFIHGRNGGWFRGPTAAIWAIIGFYSVLFTFYGVSFVLPGLHSYLSG